MNAPNSVTLRTQTNVRSRVEPITWTHAIKTQAGLYDGVSKALIIIWGNKAKTSYI